MISGSFSARFEPDHVGHFENRCLKAAAYSGELSGRMRFRGENDYAAVDQRTVDARVTVVHRTCRRGGSAKAVGVALRSAGDYRPPTLIACGTAPGALFAATRSRYFADFFAVQYGRTSTARIIRYASAPRLAHDFTFRHDLKSAKVSPRRPIFAGSASYRNGSLSGHLTARFPGVSKVSFAPGDATLRRGEPTVSPDCPGIPSGLGRLVPTASGDSGTAGRAPFAPPRPAPSLIAPAP